MEWFREQVRDPVAVDILTSDSSEDRKLARLGAHYSTQPQFRFEVDEPHLLAPDQFAAVAR